MKDFKIIQQKEYISIYHKCKEVLSFSNSLGLIRGLSEKEDNVYFTMQSFNETNNSISVQYESKDYKIDDNIISLDNGFFRINRTWTNISEQDKQVVLNFEVNTTYNPDFYLIPCVNYNGNKWGKGNEPKGLTYKDKPWIFAYDRSGLPSATITEGDGFATTTFVSDENKESLISACSLEKNEKGMLHRILWPYREEPVAYVSRDTFGQGINDVIEIPSGGEFKTSFYLCVSNVEEKKFGFTFAYDKAEEVLKRNVFDTLSNEAVWRLGIEYTKSIFQQKEEYSLLTIGFSPEVSVDNEGNEIKGWNLNEGYEIGWCGQNATFACALIEDYIKTKNEDSLKKGIDVLDTWANNAVENNGLFQVHLTNMVTGSRSNEADTCNLGWGAMQALTAYELVKELGINKPKWLAMGTNLCDFFVEHIHDTNMFGKSWDIVNGKCLDWNGTIGCFIVQAMIKAFNVTKDEKYLKCAQKAYIGYVERDLNNMECTAGALDTTCVDKETCWPLLKCGLDLYDITNDKYYLECAIKAAYYILTWTYLYDVIYDEECDFSKYNYHTYGATSVSAQHHHLDPWGALICGDFIRLYDITKDEHWRSRALAMWKNSIIGISDGNSFVRDRLRPIGSQNEAYFHCNWSFYEVKNRRGIQNDWLVCWPTAFRLITLMKESNWEILK